jgi:nitrite reductase/ring-hydroxylating ferredoxin subunit
MAQWHDVIDATDLADGGVVGLTIEGQDVAVFRLGDAFYALRDLCPHGQARFSEGFIEKDCVECPLHQGLVDIRSGEPRQAPITEAVESFEVRQTGSRVEVKL